MHAYEVQKRKVEPVLHLLTGSDDALFQQDGLLF
jgi:hypothetical protein